MTPGPLEHLQHDPDDPHDPHDAVDAQMRATLRRHADDAPRTDLTTGALTRARRIRTRRRLTVAAAALGVAAVIVPLGTGIVRSGDDSNLADRGADETSSATSTTGLDAAAPLTEVTLSDLPSGAAPDVPYLDQGRLVRSSGTEVVPGSSGDTSRPGSAYLVDAVALDDGVVGFRADPKSQSLGLYTAGSSMLPSSPQTVQPAIDSDGSMAYAAKGVDVDGRPAQVSTIVYTSRVDGSFRFAYSDDATVTQVMDVEDGIVLYDALDAQGRRFVGRAGNFSNDARVVLDRPYPDVVALSAADQGVGLMVGRTTGMNKHCNAMLSTSDAATLWRSCSWRPTEFSPDGSRVYAVRLPIDGAITESAVLDANDGTVIRRFSTDGSFGRATFESDNALDVVTVEGGEAAIVRCSASGDCELATDLATARPDTEAAPYQLTANP